MELPEDNGLWLNADWRETFDELEPITTAIDTLGDGARGIVFLGRGSLDDPDVGHFVNVLKDGGEIRHIDGAAGTATPTPVPDPDDPYTYFALMVTG